MAPPDKNILSSASVLQPFPTSPRAKQSLSLGIRVDHLVRQLTTKMFLISLTEEY